MSMLLNSILMEAGTVSEKALEAVNEEKASFLEKIVDLLVKHYDFGKFWMSGYVILIWICIILAAACVLGVKYCQEKNAEKETEGTGGEVRVSVKRSEVVRTSTDPEPELKSVPAPEGKIFSVGKVHDIGKRKDQQDSFGVSDAEDPELYTENGLYAVVADGMGGLADGGRVSYEVVKTGLGMFYDELKSETPQVKLLKTAVKINRNVNRMLAGQTQRSGSTLVEVLCYQGRLHFLSVGDSRIYLYRQGGLICLNRPHIYAEEIALDAVNGKCELRQMEVDSQKSSLTSYIGAGDLKHIDRSEEGIALVAGDKIMLASDGVFGTLTEQQITNALAEDALQAAEQMKDMIRAANKAHQDNYTAVILEYHGE